MALLRTIVCTTDYVQHIRSNSAVALYTNLGCEAACVDVLTNVSSVAKCDIILRLLGRMVFLVVTLALSTHPQRVHLLTCTVRTTRDVV